LFQTTTSGSILRLTHYLIRWGQHRLASSSNEVDSGVILQIQLANHNTLNALMQGDIAQAQHAYTP